MDRIRKEFLKWNVYLYHISLLLLLASIPLSKFTTSVFQFFVLGSWLLFESDITYIEELVYGRKSILLKIPHFFIGFLKSITHSLIEKFKAFFHHKIALVITSLLLLHVIGLLNTSDFQYALKDLRTKLPLLLLPLFFSTGPRVNTKTLYWLYIGYAAALLGGTIYRLLLFINLPVADPRAVDAHISHIRFSLNTVYSILILIYFIWIRNYFALWHKIIFALLALWFTFFMVYLRYTTGVSILLILSMFLLIYMALRDSRIKTKLIFLITGLLIIIGPVLYINSFISNYRHTKPVHFSELDKLTPAGNSYYHDTVNFRVENGKYAGLYICEKELRSSWAHHSQLPIDKLDEKQQPLRRTLIRYLASKNLRKDSVGISQLSRQDIRNIEAGVTNANSGNGFDISTQIDNFLIGWDNYVIHHNPNSSSLIQRLEYWRTSLLLIGQHPLFGVGTGDVPDAFQAQYKKMNSTLDPQYRLRSHNQFLSITVAFGIFGLIWFLFVMVYPMLKTRSYKSYFYMIFWLIFIISLFTEDTIESQEGVTFFAYFTSLLLFALSKQAEDALE
jgi:hypothetical protein